MIKKAWGQFTNSIRLQYLVVFIVLMVVYFFTVTDFLAKGPTEEFSREITIEEVETGYIKGVFSQILVIPDGEMATLVAVDGNKTIILQVNGKGDVLKQQEVELDLYEARHMIGYFDGEDSLTVIYNHKDLFYVNIDLNTGAATSEVIESEVLSFQGEGPNLIVEKETGLYYIGLLDGIEKVVTEEIYLGETVSYSGNFDQEYKGEKQLYVMAVKEGETKYDVVLYELPVMLVKADGYYVYAKNSSVSDDGENKGIIDETAFVIGEKVIIDETKDTYVRKIEDLHVEGDLVTCMYLWTDNKYGFNYLTVHQIEQTSGKIIKEYNNEFGIHRSRFEIDEVTKDYVSIVMQVTYDGNINLAKINMYDQDEKEIIPLSKTKKLSLISEYFALGDEQCLVFVDLVEGNKYIQFASTNDELISATTHFSTINPLRVLTLSFLVVIQAVFTGATVYALYVVLGPFILVMLLNRFTKAYNNKIVIQNGIGGTIHTGIKLYFTYYLINRMGHYQLYPPVIGDQPWIYIVLALGTLLSLWISGNYIRMNKKYSSTPVYSYLVFIGSEFIQFTMLIYMYTSTFFVINKL